MSNGNKQWGHGFWSAFNEQDIEKSISNGVAEAAIHYFRHFPESDDSVRAGISEGFKKWLDENKDEVLAAIAKEHIHLITAEMLEDFVLRVDSN